MRSTQRDDCLIFEKCWLNSTIKTLLLSSVSFSMAKDSSRVFTEIPATSLEAKKRCLTRRTFIPSLRTYRHCSIIRAFHIVSDVVIQDDKLGSRGSSTETSRHSSGTEMHSARFFALAWLTDADYIWSRSFPAIFRRFALRDLRERARAWERGREKCASIPTRI